MFYITTAMIVNIDLQDATCCTWLEPTACDKYIRTSTFEFPPLLLPHFQVAALFARQRFLCEYSNFDQGKGDVQNNFVDGCRFKSLRQILGRVRLVIEPFTRYESVLYVKSTRQVALWKSTLKTLFICCNKSEYLQLHKKRIGLHFDTKHPEW